MHGSAKPHLNTHCAPDIRHVHPSLVLPVPAKQILPCFMYALLADEQRRSIVLLHIYGSTLQVRIQCRLAAWPLSAYTWQLMCENKH